tara:strand:- start:808 stop:1449 length:642 start_codon:yes stop_codon:yes gene_type:complete
MIYILVVFSLSLVSAKLPNDVRWVTSSSEYKYNCIQTYQMAYHAILDECRKSENPVIVMDLDETVLDNSNYQVGLSEKNESYNPESWSVWVNQEEANLVPGAKEFILNYKKIKNSKIIFLSNRMDKNLNATKNNMKKLSILFDDDIFLLRLDKEDTKVVRRNEIMNGIGRMEKYGKQRVIAYFGDAMGDFPDDLNYQWTVNKFIFPNPMYGKW